MTNRQIIESEQWLDQAAGFARGGDFLGAQARARFAAERLAPVAASLPRDDAFLTEARARIDLMVFRYDALVREWRAEVEARHAAYVAREQGAMGRDSSSPSEGRHGK